MVGHIETLRVCPAWAAFEKHCSDRKCKFTATRPYEQIVAKVKKEKQRS